MGKEVELNLKKVGEVEYDENILYETLKELIRVNPLISLSKCVYSTNTSPHSSAGDSTSELPQGAGNTLTSSNECDQEIVHRWIDSGRQR